MISIHTSDCVALGTKCMSFCVLVAAREQTVHRLYTPRAEYSHLSSGYADIVGFESFQEWLYLPSRHCWKENHVRTFKTWQGSLSRHRATSQSMNISDSSLNTLARLSDRTKDWMISTNTLIGPDERAQSLLQAMPVYACISFAPKIQRTNAT